MFDLENEHREQKAIMIANCQYDVLRYEGSMSEWDDVIAVYAVKLNLGDDAQEVVTFDENKAEELRSIFWSMNSIRLETETVTLWKSPRRCKFRSQNRSCTDLRPRPCRNTNRTSARD